MATICSLGTTTLPCFLRTNGISFRPPAAAVAPKLNLRLRSPRSHMQGNGSAEFPKSTYPELGTLKPLEIRFDRLQISDDHVRKLESGRYVAREALVDEEYWTAAWLRAEAEAQCEFKPEGFNYSYTIMDMMKLTVQEFDQMRRWRSTTGDQIESCTCIVGVRKKDKNVKCTVLDSIVGTLDLNLFKPKMAPADQISGIIRNMCVSKDERRRGIATNMLRFAIETAKLKGAEQIFINVHMKNTAALNLSTKMGFQVELFSPKSVEAEKLLMSLKI